MNIAAAVQLDEMIVLGRAGVRCRVDRRKEKMAHERHWALISIIQVDGMERSGPPRQVFCTRMNTVWKLFTKRGKGQR